MKNWQYTVSKNGRHQISEVNGGNVCMIWNCKEKESNAHLIKAAPKMRSMLETLSSIMPMLDEQTHPSIEMDAIKHDIDELLAEARGEQCKN